MLPVSKYWANWPIFASESATYQSTERLKRGSYNPIYKPVQWVTRKRKHYSIPGSPWHVAVGVVDVLLECDATGVCHITGTTMSV